MVRQGPRHSTQYSVIIGVLVALAAFIVTPSIAQASTDTEQVADVACVILLHGLARTASSMNDLQIELNDAGFVVANIDYRSRALPIEDLAAPAIEKGLAQCREQGASTFHVVTHSMGGILFRQYTKENDAAVFSRTVMLAPPNKGSEAVDVLRDVPGFELLNGPAGFQLGTDTDSLPLQLGPARSDVAVIAGTLSINLMLSTFLPNPDDGKVSVESTRLEGMCAHLQVPASHPFIMQDEVVMREIISYLMTGHFVSDKAEYPSCDYR